MDGTDADIQYHMGGAFRASSVGASDETQRKVQEGLLSSKTIGSVVPIPATSCPRPSGVFSQHLELPALLQTACSGCLLCSVSPATLARP